MPAFSVILPVCNAQAEVGASLRSVLAQTTQDFEVIVVDRGSTDATAAVVRGFPSVRWIPAPAATWGLAWHRAEGLARGGVLAFMEAGDVWHPRMLALQRLALDAEPGLAWSQCGPDERARPWPPEDDAASLGSFDVVDGLALAWQRPETGLSGVAVRRECLLQAGGFDPRLGEAAGLDVRLRVLARVPEVVRLHPSLVSPRGGQMRPRGVRGWVEMLDVSARVLGEHPELSERLDPGVLGRAVRGMNLGLADSLLNRGQRSTARLVLRRAARLGWGCDLASLWLRSWPSPLRAR